MRRPTGARDDPTSAFEVVRAPLTSTANSSPTDSSRTHAETRDFPVVEIAAAAASGGEMVGEATAFRPSFQAS